MIRKIALLCVLLFCCKTIFPQHVNFENISFDSSLETIETELENRGLLLVEQEYDKDHGGMLFYRGIYSNMKLSVFVRFTPFSQKIYQISVLFDTVYYDKIKEYIENKYNVKPVGLYCMSNYTSYNYSFIYDIDNSGWIGLKKDRIDIHDNEYYCLYKAEVYYPKFVKKRVLKKWQKKYNNPLFYDKNPVVKR